MIIREYRKEDLGEVMQLFYDTVHTVNRRDYTEEQVNAWAPEKWETGDWEQSFADHDSVVAEENGRLIGFGDMDETGYLDRLYVHRDFQRQGVGSGICGVLESRAKDKKLTVHASVTSVPFFESRGYRAVREQQVERDGVLLTNFVMERERPRRYEAIDKVGRAAVDTGLCRAIVLKGSIGRGDDDAYSDIDMYVVTAEGDFQAFLDKRLECLKSYGNIVFWEENQFSAPQLLAIYENGLHVDLYTVTAENMEHSDPVKVHYDPEGIFADYLWDRPEMSPAELAASFSSALYYMVEADTAYCRKNYAWTARILDSSVAESARLLRFLYDRQYAFLGLKKLNEIVPPERFRLVEEAYANLREGGFQRANECVMELLELFLNETEEAVKSALNLGFYRWMQKNINNTLFRP